MRHKVLFTERYLTEEGKAYLEQNDCEVVTRFLRWQPEKELIDALKDCDAVIAGGEVYSEQVINSAKKLKIIARLGAGYDHVDLSAASRAGVTVTNTPGATSKAVAEMVLGLMLALLRRIPIYDAGMKRGIWDQEPTVTELGSSAVGIVGMGFIGREVIRLLQSFGPRVVAYDVVWDPDFARANAVERVSMERLMEVSDIVSIHVPLNEKTRGLINAGLLKRMKSTAYLINTSRGAVIEKEALKYALENHLLAGAALDAHWDTPAAPDDPIVRMENVIATPMVGYNTRQCQARMVKAAAEEVVAVLNGRTPRYALR